MRIRRALAAVGFCLTVVAGSVAGFGPGATTPAAAQGEALTIEKFVQGAEADTAPGPIVASGATVAFRYDVVVNSNEPLFDFVISDDSGVTPRCDSNNNGKLDPGEFDGHPGDLEKTSYRFSCWATATAGEPGVTYAGFGRVEAWNTDFSNRYEAKDVGHYTTAAASPTTAAPTSAAPTTPPTTATSTSPSVTKPPTTASPPEQTNPPSSTVATTSPTTVGSGPEDSGNGPGPSEGDPFEQNDGGSSTTLGSLSSRHSPLDSADDENRPAPNELAADDSGLNRGLSFWWLFLVLAAAAGAVALAILGNPDDGNESVPGRWTRD